ncbi:MAG: 2,3-bisphosphoglycerate-independent phosphoglycerate mutase [Defluviitaleaceae bacterium]|nr:2,3-bisphosphoglycerate-independent phosphoglycerate mutase [Defluviitaleaceae bacterium]MCL2203789.1 2,3-bisphosphoglycerate-independent phosphoglycerate mutase [Defluviitaleaceae bacterium]MCL2239258.1 2,3-bisphosphoglycerate-independent phosphoglycerate mutase [Defluviitaleaceae bacterium]
MGNKDTVVLMILDGYGLSDAKEGNAIALADTPHLDWLMEKFPFQPGAASGMDVGLPAGQMGNSEVGHTNIGAGRVVYQELTRITKAIEDGDFFKNPALLVAMENCKKNNTSLHLYGLLSDGGVHSHNTHLYGLLELAKRNGLERVFVHAFLDGRDTPPQSGKGFLLELENKMREIGVGQIASVSGRYYAMDRDNRWERVKIAYDALVLNKSADPGEVTVQSATSATACIDASYAAGINDEFVVPTVITQNASGTLSLAAIKPDDSVIFFNFRPDRAREITRAFCDPDFDGFERADGFFPLHYVCFTEYDATIPNKHVAFHAQSMDNVLGQYLADKNMTQLRLAETEKYAHVTFFFNGGREEPYTNEDRILVPSPKVATYDLQPEMSAPAVADKLVEAIESQQYDLIVVNFANCDMVGHTGVMSAAVQAVETVDGCVAQAMDAMLKTGARMFFCADHGNADKMLDEVNGGAFTAHTTNPVPFVLFNCPHMGLKPGGRLADIAPTLLDLMELEIPKEMTGESLLIRKG